ncbi:KRAB [Acanthosepion pharaonis]|uniref:KRAB n=1 Tax=Acanthosepion pharaonis TaxID=158019 RepID=A0A812EAN6_ACAPH|nr:KRAB [Sepia pharaonis]
MNPDGLSSMSPSPKLFLFFSIFTCRYLNETPPKKQIRNQKKKKNDLKVFLWCYKNSTFLSPFKTNLGIHGNISGGKQLSMGHHTLESSQRASHLSQNVFPPDVYGTPFSQSCYLPAMTVAAMAMNLPEKMQNAGSSGGYGGGSNNENCSGYHSKSSSHKGSSGDGNSSCDGRGGSGCGEVPCTGHLTAGKSASYHHPHHHNQQHSGSGDGGGSSTGSASGSVGKKYNQSSKSDAHYPQNLTHQQALNQRQLNQQSSSSSSTQHEQQHHQPNMQAHYTPKQTSARLKQLFCDYCGKEFAQEYLMLNHRRTHTGEKPFPCDICGKHFGRKDTLQRHRRNHNPEAVPVARLDASNNGLLKEGIGAGIDHAHTLQGTNSIPEKEQRMMSAPHQDGSVGNSVFVRGKEGEVGTMVVMPFSHGNQKAKAPKEQSHDNMLNSMISTDIPKSTKTYQCDICLKPFAQRHYLRIHRRSHTGEKPYQCDYCIQKFARRDTLLIHRRTQHTGERPHHCELCGEAFFHRAQLQMHRRSKHVLKASNSNIARGNSTTSGDDGGGGGDDDDESAGGVISGNHVESSFTMGAVSPNAGMMVYRKRYQCDYCYKQFAQCYYLQIHRRIHTGEKLLQCDVCFKKFTQRHYLTIHKRTHTGEKPFQCDFCIQKFARKTTLQIHRRMHTGERPFQCEVCQKRFAQRDKLTVHLRTHSPKKRYRCEICFKLFAQRHYLQLHHRSHTGEKPFQCEVCYKRFSRKNSLQMHHRSHTGEKPFQCEVCFKRFAQRQYLQLHKRTHTGEKAYQCETCAKQFARRDTLQRHMRIHTKHLLKSGKSNEEDIPPMTPYMWSL